MTRWTEADLQKFVLRTGAQPLGQLSSGTPTETPTYRRESAPATGPNSAPSIATKTRRESVLESVFSGHITLMELQPWQAQFKLEETGRRWRYDFAFPDARVLVELHGGLTHYHRGELQIGKHSRERGQINDFEKSNAAQVLGWLCLTYGREQVMTGAAALEVERIVKARRASAAAAV